MSHEHILGALFSSLRNYNHFLRGCAQCKILWIAIKDNSLITDREFWSLADMIYTLNKLNDRLSATDLAQFDVHYSSSLCTPCIQKLFGEKYQAKQRKEGNFPCFGTATNGYCDQFGCMYRGRCITHPGIYPNEKKYFHHLYEKIKLSCIVLARE